MAGGLASGSGQRSAGDTEPRTALLDSHVEHIREACVSRFSTQLTSCVVAFPQDCFSNAGLEEGTLEKCAFLPSVYL